MFFQEHIGLYILYASELALLQKKRVNKPSPPNCVVGPHTLSEVSPCLFRAQAAQFGGMVRNKPEAFVFCRAWKCCNPACVEQLINLVSSCTL